MSADKPEVESTNALPTTEVLAILTQILAMPKQQRLSLGKAWVAMDPLMGFEFPQDGYSPDDQEAQPGVVDTNDVAKLNEWIDKQQSLLPRDRIAKLQSALDQESEEWPIPLLNAEITKVKNANPWLAAELAVVRYAYEHPVLLIVALSGLGLGIYRVGKAIFTVVF